MKQKTVLSLAGLLMVCALASCNRTSTSGKPTTGNSNTPTSDSTAKEDFSSITNGFDKTLSGTVKATYEAKFQTNIDANGGTANLDSFKRNIESKTTVEADYTAGNYYVKVSTETVDKMKNSTTKVEGLLFKGEDNKYYSMTTMSTAAELVSDDKVLDTINSLISTVSNVQVGGVSSSSFLYKTGKAYELSEFALTDTFTADDLEDPVYSKNAKGGLKVEYKPLYIGYQTDNGVSDFKNHKDSTKPAATVVLNTDAKGHVTDYTETYTDTGLDMPIMTPAPTVLITGTRTLNSEFGATLNKVSTIDHNTDTAYVNIKRDQSVQSVKLSTMILAGQTPSEITPVELTNYSASTKVAANKWAALVVKCITGFEVDSVTVNGKPCMNINGQYCFNISAAGVYNVEVKSKNSAGTVEYLTIGNVTKGEHVKEVVVDYIVSPNFSEVKHFTDNKATFENGMFICVKATFDDGFDYDEVKVNDTVVTMVQAGYYCTSAKTAGTYNISVTAKAN